MSSVENHRRGPTCGVVGLSILSSTILDQIQTLGEQGMIYERIKACRASGSDQLETIIEFGETPLADRLVTEETAGQEEPKAPLTLLFCPDSGLVQIAETVKPEILFYSEYP